jgi:hypothetical protein
MELLFLLAPVLVIGVLVLLAGIEDRVQRDLPPRRLAPSPSPHLVAGGAHRPAAARRRAERKEPHPRQRT